MLIGASLFDVQMHKTPRLPYVCGPRAVLSKLLFAGLGYVIAVACHVLLCPVVTQYSDNQK